MIWKIGSKLLSLEKTSYLMGILNVTPDSFSDGGQFWEKEQALAHADQMIKQGALMIDIGGESSRPGALPVSEEEELSRVIPVVKALRMSFPHILISVDTVKVAVAAAALSQGAHIINDIEGFSHPAMRALIATSDCGLIVMHKKGTPATMQEAPTYTNVIHELNNFFQQQYNILTREGVDPRRICFDPGIGFGKTSEHNVEILQHLSSLETQGCALMMALSRKRFLGTLLNNPQAGKTPLATAVATVMAHQQGARIHRVHDVEACYQALLLAQKLETS